MAFLLNRPLMNPSAAASAFDLSKWMETPILSSTWQRNATMDQFFYDIGSLTEAEADGLMAETNTEGSIIVVFPREARGDVSYVKHQDYQALRDAPGPLLSRFSVAGIGSSDLGAAAFARNLADHYQEPVGAVIAGYGMMDAVAEGWGGWLALGMGKHLMRLAHDLEVQGKALLDGLSPSRTAAEGDGLPSTGNPDCDTLLRLLLDDDREIKMLMGHSKGCLSIAFALQALAGYGDEKALSKAKSARIITTGSVVEIPGGFDNVVQFLGQLDWLGGMNSRPDKGWVSVPGAWHHSNTAYPMHMNIAEVLAEADRREQQKPQQEKPEGPRPAPAPRARATKAQTSTAA